MHGRIDDAHVYLELLRAMIIDDEEKVAPIPLPKNVSLQQDNCICGQLAGYGKSCPVHQTITIK